MAIRTVAVLGAGVMGAQLAAHLANASIPSFLFDVTPELAASGVRKALEARPAAFYHPRRSSFITPSGLEEGLEHLRGCDWVIEAVTERLEAKRGLYEKILPFIGPKAVLTSNTSGIALKALAEALPPDVRRRFFITHFFNPPRYLPLCEVVAGEAEASGVAALSEFIRRTLGKGVVAAKDTPNFIANRIGVFGMMKTMDSALRRRLRVEEVDALTGRALGRPKSATFRTADVVGLDTLAFVAGHSYDVLPNDEARELFKPPAVLEALLKRGALGQKSGAGFYKKEGKEILALDFEALDYRPQVKTRFDGVKAARRFTDPKKRIVALLWSPDPAGTFTWELVSATLLYAARRIPEIADSIVQVDQAMKWGFGWDLGPFELWDALGFERTALRMEADGQSLPEPVARMLKEGVPSFYGRENGRRTAVDFADVKPAPLPEEPGVLRLEEAKVRRGVIARNWNASLVDLGDGVACLEFHSVLQPDLHPVDGAVLEMLGRALQAVPKLGFRGLVIGHQGGNFCAGANLQMILELAKSGRFDLLERVSKTFQDLGQAIKYAPFPVVAAPRGLTLGGGFEMAAPSDRIVALAETYCGAVEVGVGLTPGAGGNLRVLENFIRRMAPARPGPFPPVQKAFETIAFGKVSTSAEEAVELGYFRPEDRIVLSADLHLAEAKAEALKLAGGYAPPEAPQDLVLPGEGGRLAVEGSIANFVKLGKISLHDALIGRKLAWVLTGGAKADGVHHEEEQYLLDLEREAFLSLAGEPKSQERMAYMLKEGKPLRN